MCLQWGTEIGGAYGVSGIGCISASTTKKGMDIAFWLCMHPDLAPLPDRFIADPPAEWVLRGVRLGESGPQARAVDVHVVDGRIRDIQEAGGSDPCMPGIDATGLVAFPGFVNAHTHSTEQFDQGAYEADVLEVWLAMAYPVLSGTPAPERWHYLRAMMLAMQSLRSGVTALHDDFVEPTGDAAALSQVLAAYRDVGVRARVAVTLVDRSYLDGLPLLAEYLPASLLPRLGQAPARNLDAQAAFFVEASAHAQRDGERIGVSLGPRGPQRCSPALLRTVAELARRHEVPVHMHVLETRAQALAAQRQYGRTFVDVLDEVGLLGPSLTLNHAVWLTRSDVDRIAQRQACVVHNPLSNFKLASGLCPLKALRAAGVTVGLGTDGAATGDSVDYADTLRFAALTHTLDATATLPAPRAQDVLDMATRGGAATLGAGASQGRIAPGQRADLVLMDLSDPAFVPLNDPVRQLCFAATSRAVRLVIVEGVVVHAHGRCTRVDETALRAEIAAAAAEHRERREQVPHPDQDALLGALRRMTSAARAQSATLSTINRVYLG